MSPTVRLQSNSMAVMFDGYEVGPSIKDCSGTRQQRSRKLNANKVTITEVTKFIGKKEDFLSNRTSKHTLIYLIMEQMRQNGCALRSQRRRSICLLSEQCRPILEKTQILFSCSTMQRIPLVKQFAMTKFMHAFSGCDSLCILRSWRSNITREKNNERPFKSILSIKEKSRCCVNHNFWRYGDMVALFNADQKNSRASIRYNVLCKKVARAKLFVTP